MAKGKSYDEAQSIAAATYNKTHKSAPITGKHEPKRAHKKKTTPRILSYGKTK